MNCAMAVSVLSRFANTQLPGITGNLHWTYKGRNVSFPELLFWGLEFRKHLGLNDFLPLLPLHL
jgi:hypothetical protein